MNDKIVKIAAYGFVGLVVAPIVINGGISVINLTSTGINTLLYNRKIKKGLKDGSIVEVNGQYYEVKIDD